MQGREALVRCLHPRSPRLFPNTDHDMLTCSEAEDGEAVPAESAEELGRPGSEVVATFIFGFLPNRILRMCCVGQVAMTLTPSSPIALSSA